MSDLEEEVLHSLPPHRHNSSLLYKRNTRSSKVNKTTRSATQQQTKNVGDNGCSGNGNID
jgi:hypothetical protein